MNITPYSVYFDMPRLQGREVIHTHCRINLKTGVTQWLNDYTLGNNIWEFFPKRYVTRGIQNYLATQGIKFVTYPNPEKFEAAPIDYSFMDEGEWFGESIAEKYLGREFLKNKLLNQRVFGRRKMRRTKVDTLSKFLNKCFIVNKSRTPKFLWKEYVGKHVYFYDGKSEQPAAIMSRDMYEAIKKTQGKKRRRK